MRAARTPRTRPLVVATLATAVALIAAGTAGLEERARQTLWHALTDDGPAVRPVTIPPERSAGRTVAGLRDRAAEARLVRASEPASMGAVAARGHVGRRPAERGAARTARGRRGANAPRRASRRAARVDRPAAATPPAALRAPTPAVVPPTPPPAPAAAPAAPAPVPARERKTFRDTGRGGDDDNDDDNDDDDDDLLEVAEAAPQADAPGRGEGRDEKRDDDD